MIILHGFSWKAICDICGYITVWGFFLHQSKFTQGVCRAHLKLPITVSILNTPFLLNMVWLHGIVKLNSKLLFAACGRLGSLLLLRRAREESESLKAFSFFPPIWDNFRLWNYNCLYLELVIATAGPVVFPSLVPFDCCWELDWYFWRLYLC